MFKCKNIFLRPIESSDLQTLLLWENNVENWRYSETEAPMSMFEIQAYIESASQVRQNQQVRFIICKNENHEAIGTVDLFEIDFRNKRAGVGILIAEKENRQLGYAEESLHLLDDFARNSLDLIQLYCTIQADNKASINLFEKAGYLQSGIKKSWYLIKNEKIDAYFYQKILK